MKVLSPREVNNRRREQDELQVQKTIKIQELVQDANAALINAKDRHDKEVRRLAEQFLKLTTEMSKRKAALEAEVRVLEDRKARALKPTLELEKVADAKVKEANVIRLELNRELLDVAQLKQELILESKKVAERLVRVVQKEDYLLNEKIGLHAKSEEWEVMNQELRNREKEFETKCASQEAEMSKKRMDLELETQSIAVQRKIIKEQKTKNDVERARLEDRQATLQAAFEELKQKNV